MFGCGGGGDLALFARRGDVDRLGGESHDDRGGDLDRLGGDNDRLGGDLDRPEERGPRPLGARTSTVG